ncbi:MAG: esterase family protein [Ignavibacteria bacterium]|jgi:S-formylglutathione hydrolase FrmB|nr:esterase family protein [Ignavibacteria bacterium]MCU7501620.1 esterase family protein [Ignavibacteria bacterium]MCU7518467.1 esterase family protein [Ignavibacteria bacterium]
MKKIILILLLISMKQVFSQDLLIKDSPNIPHADTSLVFLPGGYDEAKSYPLLIMLHGWSGNYKQWDEVTGGLKKYADKYQFIIVCPDGFYDSWYVDSPVKLKSQFETFFTKELLPEVESKYRVDRSNIFITGLSMGGHGAMMMLLKHPDTFKSAGSTSGILDITEFPDRWSMLNALGRFTEKPENWKKNSDIFLLDKIKGLNKEVIFDCGTEDFAYNVNKRFNEKCLSLKIKATFISQPGNHSKQYWNKSIENHFRFFKALSENKPLQGADKR